jgi:hypothetical protein
MKRATRIESEPMTSHLEDSDEPVVLGLRPFVGNSADATAYEAAKVIDRVEG